MDVYNYGFIKKIVIPIDEMEKIINQVSEVITVKISDWTFTGELLKVNSKKIKDENGDTEIFKELTISVDSISLGDKVIAFPDKKEIFIEEVKIVI